MKGIRAIDEPFSYSNQDACLKMGGSTVMEIWNFVSFALWVFIYCLYVWKIWNTPYIGLVSKGTVA